MDNKNNLIILLLVILIAAVSGLALVIGVNNTVRVAIGPLNVKLSEIERGQISLENKLNALETQLGGIQKDLGTIQIKGNGGNLPQAPRFPEQDPEDLNKVYQLDPGTSPVIGKKDAPVTIVEFADFQCPFCSRFYPVAKDVLAAYPDKVRFIVKNFPLPFHSNARSAAKLALAANEQGQYQGMMEAILASGADVTDTKIKEYAQKLHLDYNKLMADFKGKDAQWEKQIQEDMQLAGRSDVRGTPTFYLNGRKTMARDINAFKTQVDAALAGKKAS
ncbi:MAG: thioredoxin domain-containing protein [Candidatus Omnitrophica bacterium]|nr:thioredoxin domain-containing protein [Candidatus Omnitrophota bacterium]